MNEWDRQSQSRRKEGREGGNKWPLPTSPVPCSSFSDSSHSLPRWLCTCLFWEVTCSLLSPVPSQWLSCNSIINKHLLNGCFVTEKYYQVSLEKGYRQGLLSEVSKKAVVAIAAIQERDVGEWTKAEAEAGEERASHGEDGREIQQNSSASWQQKVREEAGTEEDPEVLSLGSCGENSAIHSSRFVRKVSEDDWRIQSCQRTRWGCEKIST